MSDTKPGYFFVLPWSISASSGVDQVVLNLYRHFFTGERFRPVILQSTWDNPQPPHQLEQDVEVCSIRLRSPVGGRKGIVALLAWAVRSWPELWRLDRLLVSRDTAVVNVHFPTPSAIQFLMLRWFFRRQFQLILSFHGMDVANVMTAQGVERFFWRRLIASADRIVCCSSDLARRLIEVDAGVAEKCGTVHNGLDVAYLFASRDLSVSLDPALRGRPYILCVAAYEKKKGLDVLVRAFKQVHASVGGEIALVLVGAERGEGDTLRQLASDPQIQDSVFIIGAVPHNRLHVYYESATMFCLPSRSEPFGIVLLEAGAFRLPIVATRVGGIPEILTHETNARLVPSEDPVALAKELTYLLRNPQERARLGDLVVERVQRDFSWERAYEEYLALCGLGSTGVSEYATTPKNSGLA